MISHWTEYLGDTRVIDSQNVNMVDFCADGTDYFFRVTTQNYAQMAGESFDWEVLAAIGGRWNESKLRITPMDTSIVLANLSGNPYNESVLRAPAERGAMGGRSADAFARVEHLPGILHPNEFGAVFTFGDSADTVCRQ